MKQYLFLLALIIYLPTIAVSNNTLISPRHCIENHYRNLQQNNYLPERAALSLDPVGLNSDERIELSIKLKQFYDAKGFIPDFSKIPSNTDYFDSLNNAFRYIPFPKFQDLYIEKKGDKWIYSSYSVSLITKLHKEAYPFGTDRLLRLIPQSSQIRFPGIETWKLWGILILLLGSFIIFYLLKWFNEFIIYRVSKKFIRRENASSLIKPVAKPLSLLIIFSLLTLFIPLLQFPEKTNHYLIIGCKIFESVFTMLIFYKLVDILGAYLSRKADLKEKNLSNQLVPLLNKFLKVIVVISGILLILNTLNFNIAALVAGISIGGLALALAAQDTIKNLFGSLMIFVDRPFQIGDWIVTDNVDGIVEEVGFRTTRVRTFKNSVVSVPNGKLADLPIDNTGLRTYRRFNSHIDITYDTPPVAIEAYLSGIREIIKSHPFIKKDKFEVHLNELGAYSLKILADFFIDTNDWSVELRVRHEFLMAVIRLAEELGITFAYPTSTLQVEHFPGQPSLTTRKVLSKEEYSKKTMSFISNLRNSKFFKEKTTPKPAVPEKSPETRQTTSVSESISSATPQRKQDNSLGDRVVKKGRSLTNDEIKDAAADLKISIAVMRTLIEAESIGKGFLQNGKPFIRFHGHKFWKELKKRNINPEELAAKNPTIIFERWTKKYYAKDEKEYDRLEKAKSIHKEAAYMATNWGLFQIAGSEYKLCGFNSISEFVFNIYQTEKEHLEAFIQLIKSKNLIKELQELNWAEYIRKMHGPSHSKADLISKFQKIYQKNLESNYQ